MELSNVVFIETSILIASSMGGSTDLDKIKHEKYDASIHLIRKACKKSICITTYNIDKLAKETLDKAVEKKCNETGNYDILADALNIIRRKYLENIRTIDILGVIPNEVDKLFEEVLEMYRQLQNKALEEPQKIETYDSRFIGLARELNKHEKIKHKKLFNKMVDKPLIPDDHDIEHLSEAICIKRNKFNKDIFFIFVSLDNHFIGTYPPYDIIPPEIEKRYNIKCLSPEKVHDFLK